MRPTMIRMFKASRGSSKRKARMCMYVLIYVRHACMCACANVCMYECMHITVGEACAHVCLHVWVSVWVCVRACVFGVLELARACVQDSHQPQGLICMWLQATRLGRVRETVSAKGRSMDARYTRDAHSHKNARAPAHARRTHARRTHARTLTHSPTHSLTHSLTHLQRHSHSLTHKQV